MTRKPLGKLVKLLISGLLLLPLLGFELWVRSSLFDYASYTNSQHFDAQLGKFTARSADWTVLALGSSEVRYGFSPETFDRTLSHHGIPGAVSFNLGIDGFNTNHYRVLLPYLKLADRAQKLRVVLIGVNMMEEKKSLPHTADEGFDCRRMAGALQKSVYTSSFGKDTGLWRLCVKRSWTDPLLRLARSVSAVIRYRQSIRGFLLGYENFLRGDIRHQTERGHYAVNGMKQKDYDFDIGRWLKKIPSPPRVSKPMTKGHWETLVVKGGYFDNWADHFLERDILPVFFALGTNPIMAIKRNRVKDYGHNAGLMSRWAKRKGVVFVDLGIKTEYDQLGDFTDHRHLSKTGAHKFSAELARALARAPRFRAALDRH